MKTPAAHEGNNPSHLLYQVTAFSLSNLNKNSTRLSECITSPPPPPLREGMKEGYVSEDEEGAEERGSKAPMSSKIRGAALFPSARD